MYFRTYKILCSLADSSPNSEPADADARLDVGEPKSSDFDIVDFLQN